MMRVQFSPTLTRVTGSVGKGVSGGGERVKGRRGHLPLAALRRGAIWRGEKIEILKVGRFWQIAICIADSDIFHLLISPTLPGFGITPSTVSAPRPHTKQCEHQETLLI